MQVISRSGSWISEDKLKGFIRDLRPADLLGTDLFSLFIEKQCRSTSHLFYKLIGWLMISCNSSLKSCAIESFTTHEAVLLVKE